MSSSPQLTGASAAAAAAAKAAKATNIQQQVMDDLVDTFVLKLKRRELAGSGSTALQTAELLRTVISKRKFSSLSELLSVIRSIGKAMTSAHPIELSIGNIVRRVLFIIRHECAAILKEKEAAGSRGETNETEQEQKEQDGDRQQANVDLSLSLHKILDLKQQNFELDEKTINSKLKSTVIEEISMLMDEIKSAEVHISEQATEHIYAKETILTFGLSKTVCAFLKEAAGLRKFEVILAESSPSFSGHKQALALQAMGIETTVITDSAVFAIMSSVNKVIIGTHAVMANGGLIAHTGANNIAMAAKHYSVPVVVLAGLHKLCPLYSFDQNTFNEQNAPSQLLKFEDDYPDTVDIENPAYDYVTPDLVSLYLTNIGGHNPSYIYRLLAEYYDPQDYSL